MKELRKNFWEYLILFLGVITFVILVYLFRFNKSVLTFVLFSGSLFYVSWGIIHHMIRGRLTRMIAVEYMLFGFLSFLLLFAVLGY